MIESEKHIEQFLFRLSDICRDAGVSGYDQVILSLGLIYLISDFDSYRSEIDFAEPLQERSYGDDKLRILENLIQEKFRDDFSSEDIQSQLMVSFRRVNEKQLFHLIDTIQQIDFHRFERDEVFFNIKQFVARSLMFDRKTSYYISNFQLGELFNRIIEIHPHSKIYDPAAGLGIMMSFLNLNNTSEIILQDINNQVIILSKLLWKFIAVPGETKFISGNSLFEPYPRENDIDVVIGELPFGKMRQKDRLDPSIWIPSSDFPELFIQLSISRLNENGKAYLLIPDGFLFSQSRYSKKLKEELVGRDLIESIISLPGGFLKPYSGVKTSLLIINKSKPSHRAGRILLIDAEGEEISKNHKIAPQINVDNIVEIYQSDFVNDHDNSVYLYNEEAFDRDLDLQVKRYLFESQLDLQANLEPHEQLISFGELVESIRSRKHDDFKEVPFLKVGDLAKDLYEYNLNVTDIVVIDERKKGRIINESALLLARVGGDLKPTYFEYTNQEVSLNPNIFPFRVNTDLVDREYLIFELSSEFFLNQLKAIKSGTTIPVISRKDLLNLKIRLTSLERQKEFVAQEKDRLLNLKKQEFDQLRDKLQVEDKGLEIISNFKHDFMGNLEKISSGISVLTNFLKQKEEEGEVLDLSEPIIEPLDEDDTTSSETLQDWLDRLQMNAKNAIGRLENEIEQIKEDRETYKLEDENVFHLLKKIKQEYPNTPLYRIDIQKGIGFDDIKNLTAKIDANQFQKAIDNLIKNAIRHGFAQDESRSYKIIFVVDVIKENGISYILISYKNNGVPFPEGFTFNDFIQRGKKAGANGQFGIGGDRINRIISRHNGIFRESIDGEMSKFNINFEILIPQSL